MVATQRRNNVFLFGIAVIIAFFAAIFVNFNWYSGGEVKVAEREVIELLEIDFTTHVELLGIPPEDVDEELEYLALNAYFEARGDVGRFTASESMTAVTQQSWKFWKKNACQFSWWCDGKDDTPYDKKSIALAYKVADKVLNKPRFDDPTHGATHYYNPSIVRKTPKWARGKTPCAIIGSHHFFCDVV